jgi:hypothetical protein
MKFFFCISLQNQYEFLNCILYAQEPLAGNNLGPIISSRLDYGTTILQLFHSLYLSQAVRHKFKL